jgi:phage pi2 protein 07
MTVLASIRNQLVPGLLEISGEYPKAKAEWQKVFVTKTSRMAQERSLQVRYVGPARQKQETGSVFYDNESGDRWVYTMEPIEATIGLIH